MSNSQVEGSSANTADDEHETAPPSIELNLRLDENGRTTFDPAAAHQKVDASVEDTNNNAEQPSKRAKTETESSTMDYSSKSVLTNLHGFKLQDAMDSLLFDCEITDCGLLPRTFWMPAKGMEPRCFLENLAMQIFHHHVPKSSNFYYDEATSGSEWWVQIRPSPPAGRYSMLADESKDDKDDLAKSGISFHWDKDEDLRLLCGGSMYIHPHLSTVTYLTDIGAPTMVLSKRVDSMTGENIVEECDTSGFIAWPKTGKHLSFDGRYLHAAPSDLMERGAFDEQCKFAKEGLGDKQKKVAERRHRRVTFLVNIWLNYKPFNVNLFPDTMLNSLSKADLFDEFALFNRAIDDRKHSADVEVSITSDGAKEVTAEVSRPVDTVCMTWPMGAPDDDEQIQVPIPLGSIRK
ncbi:hypothetical protein ACHAXN_010511 [Cyclotella atomus]